MTVLQNVTVFLDRDGVICYERPDYVKTISEMKFIGGALEAIRELTRANLPVIVITNQSAVGRGIITEEQLKQLHSYMISEVERMGGRIQALFYCPHRPEEACSCRKPKIGLFLQAKERFATSFSDSWLIGDKESDREAGMLAGCKTIIIPSNTNGALYEAVGRVITTIKQRSERN